MNSRSKPIKNWKLYVILSKVLVADKDLGELAEDVIEAGADAIQLRDKVSADGVFLKDACLVRDVARRSGIPLVINDRTDIAKAIGAEGVHLGQDDICVDDARKILGKEAIVGVSCHSVKQALRAQADGADYIGLGPIFKTPTKPELKPIGLRIISIVRERIDIPVVCIGGINTSNIKKLLSSGATTVALVSAVINIPYIAKTIREEENDTAGICQE